MEFKMNLKPYKGPPYLWKVLVDGIQNILGKKKAKKIVKIKEKF